MANNIFFDEFVDPFALGPFVIRAEHYMRYVFAASYLEAHLSKVNVIYDLGCGNGYGAKILTDAGIGFTRIGFDNSSKLIHEAEQRNIPKTKWITTDFDSDGLLGVVKKKHLPRPDVAIAFEILEHLENPAEFLKQIYELLPEQGLLIASVPNERFEPKKKGKSKNKFHKQLFSEEKIIMLLKSVGFHISSRYGQPKANAFYHRPKLLVKSVDFLANTSPLLFSYLASKIAAVEENTQQTSYSMIFIAKK